MIDHQEEEAKQKAALDKLAQVYEENAAMRGFLERLVACYNLGEGDLFGLAEEVKGWLRGRSKSG